MSNTTTTVPTAAPADTAYVYAADTVVAAYRAGAVRLDVARRAAHTAMSDAVRDASTAMSSGDADAAMAAMAAAQTHTAAIDALDAVAKSATSSARVITASDYATATCRRVAAMADAAYALATGHTVPTDVPSAMADDYRAALVAIVGTDYHAWRMSLDTDYAADSDTESATAYATRRVIGNADVTRHYAEIASGRAYDRHGAAFVPVVGTVYPFSVIANLRTDEYPDGSLSNGAAAAAYTRRDENKRPARFTYVNNGVPGSRATHGVRFDG